jgi:non-heme chloroperoxidase
MEFGGRLIRPKQVPIESCNVPSTVAMLRTDAMTFFHKSERFARPLAAALCVMLVQMGSTKSWEDPSPHVVRFIEVEPSVTLEVLDWGGAGEPILLLAGHGDTGHVFDDFAPRLTRHGRVLALTRRGFGASDQPQDGYVLATLVRDIERVVAALKLKRVHIVGHSIAGDEMTRFARTYPDRVGKLVYLEAAYDRVKARQVESTFPKLPAMPEPAPSELASPEQVHAVVARRTGILMPESEIRATRVFAPDGRLLRPVTPNRILRALAEAVERPDYSSIRAPVLAIYAVPKTPVELIPRYGAQYEAGEPETRQVLDKIFEIWKPAAKAQRDRFRKAVPHARIVELAGANHYVFVSNRDDVLREIAGLLTPH